MGSSSSSLPGDEVELEAIRRYIPFIVSGPYILPRDNQYDAAGRLVSATSQHTYTVYHGAAQIGVGAIAGALLLFCALLAGLTLAICGLDDTLLRMRVATGTAKERYVNILAALEHLITSFQEASGGYCTNETPWILDAV